MDGCRKAQHDGDDNNAVVNNAAAVEAAAAVAMDAALMLHLPAVAAVDKTVSMG